MIQRISLCGSFIQEGLFGTATSGGGVRDSILHNLLTSYSESPNGYKQLNLQNEHAHWAAKGLFSLKCRCLPAPDLCGLVLQCCKTLRPVCMGVIEGKYCYASQSIPRHQPSCIELHATVVAAERRRNVMAHLNSELVQQGP